MCICGTVFVDLCGGVGDQFISSFRTCVINIEQRILPFLLETV